jgi:hypothetical protein
MRKLANFVSLLPMPILKLSAIQDDVIGAELVVRLLKVWLSFLLVFIVGKHEVGCRQFALERVIVG